MCSCVPGGRHAVTPHKVLSKGLARFKPGSRSSRPDYRQASPLKFVNNPKRQRSLSADESQVYLIRRRKLCQFIDLVVSNRHTLGNRRDARVAVGTNQPLSARRLPKSGTDRMLTPARTYHKNIHTILTAGAKWSLCLDSHILTM